MIQAGQSPSKQEDGHLLLPASVGGVEVQAFIDSGAQTNIMSKPFADYLISLGHIKDPSRESLRSFDDSPIATDGHISTIVALGPSLRPLTFVISECAPFPVTLGLPYLSHIACSIDFGTCTAHIPSGLCPGSVCRVPALKEADIERYYAHGFRPPRFLAYAHNTTV